jgi:hypothetical protein
VSDDFKIQVNFKVPTSNDNYRDSLVNVRANDAEELGSTLDDLIAVAASVVQAGAALNAAALVAYGLGAVQVGPTQTETSSSSASQGSASQGQAAAQGDVQNLGPDNFGRTFVVNHPDAPLVPEGKSQGQRAVRMTASKQNGQGTYSKWIDPASKEVPGNYQKGIRDKGDWPGEFVK